jgi:hypothetical protein
LNTRIKIFYQLLRVPLRALYSNTDTWRFGHMPAEKSSGVEEAL